ncbi:hypothetical protein CERSUDRAFT_111263 [Gelatoporia subvermispora B]|uniref:Uncharacterized protein n=1 Tax=Ceriporiopsis subvermispora (strain B) TaxID=914234 RepID=M2QUE3_CERS8|nr:hypothetical protein CERSUDRAFT_111263 [Gelatoporia subvermispora B]
MKYRSESPDDLPESGLPTPPHSPRALEPADSAVFLLDSLTTFYQQERYWIHHTRAALELALTKGIDAPAITFPSSASSSTSTSSEATSPASSLASLPGSSPECPSSMNSDEPVVKTEPGSPPSVSTKHTRWLRRKNMMKLKLDGISSQAHARRRRPHRAPPTEPGARLLEMFSELVDARMESCQRVSRLVREAGRPDLCMC